MNKERLYHADVVRIVACLMVVLMHSPMPGDRLIPIFTSGLTYFTMPCIGLFFTLSGYLLLPVKSAPSDSFIWAWKRIKKFLWPLIIWSLIYLLVNGVLLSGDFAKITKSLCSIPFSPQEGVLWFMYVLIGLYFVAPVISPWLQQTNKKTLQCYLALWGVSLLFPYLMPFVNVCTDAYGVLYYMSGFLGYFLLGYYIRLYGIVMKPWEALCGIIVCMGTYVAYKILLENRGLCFDGGFGYLSIDNPLLVVFWWNLLQPISQWVKESKDGVRKSIVTISNLGFGVYLSHLLVMRYGLYRLELIQNINNYMIQTALIFFLSFFLSFVFVYIISLTSFSNYIIAYKKK